MIIQKPTTTKEFIYYTSGYYNTCTNIFENINKLNSMSNIALQ